MDAEDLVDLLNDLDGVTASLDESKLGRLPAVWVRPVGLRRDTLAGGWTERVQLRLLASDKDPKRNRTGLRDLFNTITAGGVDPDDDPAFATVLRPSTGQPVPALVFPVDLLP